MRTCYTQRMTAAKGTPDGWLNLAAGEPEHLRYMASDAEESYLSWVSADKARVKYGYPDVGGHPHLLEQLRRLQSGYRYHVVVAGAKQGLAAAIYAVHGVRKPDARQIVHLRPCWPGHRDTAGTLGIPFVPASMGNGYTNRDVFLIFLNTYPNNPDGRQLGPPGAIDVCDFAYAHPLYRWDGQVPEHRIGVFSTAKLFGFSHRRVAWVGTDDADLAVAAADFVEASSSGVSQDDQHFLTHFLTTQSELPIPRAPYHPHLGKPAMGDVYARAQATMIANCISFHEHLAPHTSDVRGLPTPSGAGMFAWFKPTCGAAKFIATCVRACVKVTPGSLCGDSDYVRVTMSRDSAVTEEALRRIAQELER